MTEHTQPEMDAMPPEFHEILDAGIDAVSSGRSTIADYVAQYPQYAEALRAELLVARLTARLRPPALAAESVDALAERLANQHRARPGTTSTQNRLFWLPFRGISRTAAAILLAVILVFGGTSGIVAAAADSMPGETLYPVKRAWESIIVLIAGITGQLDDIWLQLAETRLEEARYLAEHNALSADALFALSRATEEAIEHNTRADSADLMAFLMEAERTLSTPVFVEHASSQAILTAINPLIYGGAGAGGLPDQPGSSGDNGGPADQPDAVDPDRTLTETPVRTPDNDNMSGGAQVMASPTGTDSASNAAQSNTDGSAASTHTPTPTATSTPRIPSTPTRTPTPILTLTASPVPTLIPSATWTPLPTSTPAAAPILPTAPPTQTPRPGATLPPPTISATWYPWLQATYDVCYLTRTADPSGRSDSAACP